MYLWQRSPSEFIALAVALILAMGTAHGESQTTLPHQCYGGSTLEDSLFQIFQEFPQLQQNEATDSESNPAQGPNENIQSEILSVERQLQLAQNLSEVAADLFAFNENGELVIPEDGKLRMNDVSAQLAAAFERGQELGVPLEEQIQIWMSLQARLLQFAADSWFEQNPQATWDQIKKAGLTEYISEEHVKTYYLTKKSDALLVQAIGAGWQAGFLDKARGEIPSELEGRAQHQLSQAQARLQELRNELDLSDGQGIASSDLHSAYDTAKQLAIYLAGHPEARWEEIKANGLIPEGVLDERRLKYLVASHQLTNLLRQLHQDAWQLGVFEAMGSRGTEDEQEAKKKELPYLEGRIKVAMHRLNLLSEDFSEFGINTETEKKLFEDIKKFARWAYDNRFEDWEAVKRTGLVPEELEEEMRTRYAYLQAEHHIQTILSKSYQWGTLQGENAFNQKREDLNLAIKAHQRSLKNIIERFPDTISYERILEQQRAAREKGFEDKKRLQKENPQGFDWNSLWTWVPQLSESLYYATVGNYHLITSGFDYEKTGEWINQQRQNFNEVGLVGYYDRNGQWHGLGSSYLGSDEEFSSSSLAGLFWRSTPLARVGAGIGAGLQGLDEGYAQYAAWASGLTRQEYEHFRHEDLALKVGRGAFKVSEYLFGAALVAATGNVEALRQMTLAQSVRALAPQLLRTTAVAGGFSLAGAIGNEMIASAESNQELGILDRSKNILTNTLEGTAGSMLFMGALAKMGNAIANRGVPKAGTGNLTPAQILSRQQMLARQGVQARRFAQGVDVLEGSDGLGDTFDQLTKFWSEDGVFSQGFGGALLLGLVNTLDMGGDIVLSGALNRLGISENPSLRQQALRIASFGLYRGAYPNEVDAAVQSLDEVLIRLSDETKISRDQLTTNFKTMAEILGERGVQPGELYVESMNRMLAVTLRAEQQALSSEELRKRLAAVLSVHEWGLEQIKDLPKEAFGASGEYPARILVEERRQLMAAGFSKEEANWIIENRITGTALMDNARDLSSEAETDELEALVEELKLRNDFERLGVDFNATPEEIKIAYRKLALQYHPDRAGADASSAVKEVFDQAFRLIDQAYDRLVSGEGRKTSVDAKSKARSARAVDTTSEKASTKIYLLLTLRSLYDPIMREPDIDQLLINLDFGNEASHPDPIYFQQLRSQVIHQSMNGIISKAPLARVGKIIDFIDALYYLEVVSENVVEEWHRQIDKRLDTFTPSTPDELITNFYNRVRSGPEGLGSRLMGDTPDYYARTAVSALAENLQISEEEAAFQALEKLIELKGQKALLNGAKNYNTPGHDRLLRALINLSIQNFSVDDAEIVARVQSLILKFPHYGDLHSFLISSIPSRAREKLVSIFGYKYLRSNNVRLSGAENFKALFDFSNFSNELQKAKAANNNHQTDLVRVQARQLVSSAQVDGSIFIGEATGSIDLAELEKITRMKFEKAKRYIEEQHGVRIIVLRNEYTDPKEFWYYHLLFARDNLKGAYIPASSDSKNERAFQDKPLIVVREEHLSSLPHEFAHHLIFQSIQSASEARGLDNQLVSPYRKANQISDSMGSKSSAIWSSELKLTQPNLFSSQDIRLFLDYSIYRAQARFQRLREELAVDRAQIRTSTDPQTTQERIDHMMLELKSFDKEIRNLTYQMNRRLTRHSRYMTNEEIAQFNKVLQHLYDLKKSVTAKLDDPSYRGPIELLDVSSRAEASTSIDNILLIE